MAVKEKEYSIIKHLFKNSLHSHMMSRLSVAELLLNETVVFAERINTNINTINNLTCCGQFTGHVSKQ